MAEVYVHAAKGCTLEQKRALVKNITAAVAGTLSIAPEWVAVSIIELDPSVRANGEAVQMRGRRAARLQEILAEIHASFADPAFSPQALARRLQLSPRYIQSLLQDMGLSFTERVLELRLQRAGALLADPCNDRVKIGEIASICGFNEIPYFNRCFRRRFGASPTQYRRRHDGRAIPPIAHAQRREP
jgi:transcriptional regulator GlxA family with amidase domain